VQLGYKNKAEYKQIITIIERNKVAKIKVTIEYQCTTEEIALPPNNKMFSFEIKKGQLVLLK
jgi:hypothetical protein